MPETQAGSGSHLRGSEARSDVLSRIVATKRVEIERLRPRIPELRSAAEGAPSARDVLGALSAAGTVALVAEVKRRSPGAGAIRPDLDPIELAGAYARAGAAAISVLTDRDYFGGSLEDLGAVRSTVGVPILRKDFVLEPVQIWEARAAGADAVLLIVRILDDGPLRELRLLAEDLGMAALVEVHDAEELERALRSGCGLIGINNRDLRTFETRIETTLDLLPAIPEHVTLVSESGIRGAADVARLGRSGVDAVLVGEALLRADDPESLARALAGQPARPRRRRSRDDRA